MECKEAGRRGGLARAKNLSKDELSKLMTAAVNARWAKYRARKEGKSI